MLALSLLTLLLVTGGFAAPTQRDDFNVQVPPSALYLPGNQDQLVAPSYAPSFVTVAVGLQNYTCSQEGNWVFSGAIAQLYDITSLFPGSEFSQIQYDTYSDWTNSVTDNPADSSFVQQLESTYGITLSGQLYFIEDNVGNLSPVVEMNFGSIESTTANPNSIVVANITGDIPSPEGNPNIDWQAMTSVSGTMVTRIFQVHTKAGKRDIVEPCEPGYPGDSAKFTSQIWLYASTPEFTPVLEGEVGESWRKAV